jgi:hypothetical protein
MERDWKAALEKLWYNPPGPLWEKHKNKLFALMSAIGIIAGFSVISTLYDWEGLIVDEEAKSLFHIIWCLGFAGGSSLVYGIMMLAVIDYSCIKKRLGK